MVPQEGRAEGGGGGGGVEHAFAENSCSIGRLQDINEISAMHHLQRRSKPISP